MSSFESQGKSCPICSIQVGTEQLITQMMTMLGVRERELQEETTEEIIPSLAEWVCTAEFKVMREQSWQICTDSERKSKLKALLAEPLVKDKVRMRSRGRDSKLRHIDHGVIPSTHCPDIGSNTWQFWEFPRARLCLSPPNPRRYTPEHREHTPESWMVHRDR